MDRREKLIASVIGPELDEKKAKMLDATIKLILGDMGEQYCKMWEVEGPGVMVFQPRNKERSMFFWIICSKVYSSNHRTLFSISIIP